MLTTIAVAGHITAQGNTVAEHADGRVTISTGLSRLTGWPIGRLLKGALSAIALATLTLGGTPNLAQAETILNVSYDPTRELYREFNDAFAAHWQAETGRLFAAPQAEYTRALMASLGIERSIVVGHSIPEWTVVVGGK
mgnify:CR=1 FL=1